MKTARKVSPIHPGEILLDELKERGISLNQLSRDLRVPMNRISAIVNERRGITADTALRLFRYLGTPAELWMDLQTTYDLEVANEETGEAIEREVLPLASFPLPGKPPTARSLKKVTVFEA